MQIKIDVWDGSFKMEYHEDVETQCRCPVCQIERETVLAEVFNIEGEKEARKRNS